MANPFVLSIMQALRGKMTLPPEKAAKPRQPESDPEEREQERARREEGAKSVGDSKTD